MPNACMYHLFSAATRKVAQTKGSCTKASTALQGPAQGLMSQVVQLDPLDMLPGAEMLG